MKAGFSILLFSLVWNLAYSQVGADPIQAITDLPWGNKSTSHRSTFSFDSPPPLFVVFFKNKMIKTTAFPETLPSEVIKSVNILKDTIETQYYGKKEARNGVVEIALDDEKFPNAYKLFKPRSEWKRWNGPARRTEL